MISNVVSKNGQDGVLLCCVSMVYGSLRRHGKVEQRGRRRRQILYKTTSRLVRLDDDDDLTQEAL